MEKLYHIYDPVTLKIQGAGFYKTRPENSTLAKNEGCIKPKYNPINDTIYEDASLEEIAEANKAFVPKELSRMKFIIQVFLTTGKKYEDIVAFIQSLPDEALDDASKYIVLTKLRGCTHFERNSNDLLSIAQMMEISEDQLDEIFINGNTIQ